MNIIITIGLTVMAVTAVAFARKTAVVGSGGLFTPGQIC